MKQLTWFDLSKVRPGTRVVFMEPWDIFAENVLVNEGEQGIVNDNGLNDIWGGFDVLPDNQDIRTALKDWDGCIQLTNHEGLDPAADGETDENWQSLSPLALVEA